MANIMIFWDCSNTEHSHRRLTIYFLEITLTEENNHWRQFAFYWPIKLSIQRTFSFWEEIMNVHRLTEYMAFMMSARDVITLSFGRHSQIALTAFRLLQSSMRRYLQCMVVFLQTWTQWSRSEEWWDLQIFLMWVCCVIFFGPIRTKISRDGARTIEAFLSHLVLMLFLDSFKNMT